MSANPHSDGSSAKDHSAALADPRNSVQDDSPLGTNDTSVVFEAFQNLGKEGVGRNNSNKQKKIRKMLEKYSFLILKGEKKIREHKRYILHLKHLRLSLLSDKKAKKFLTPVEKQQFRLYLEIVSEMIEATAQRMAVIEGKVGWSKRRNERLFRKFRNLYTLTIIRS